MSGSLGAPLRSLWSAYERQLERRPVLTQMTTSAVLWGAGDVIAQRIEHWQAHKQHTAAAAAAAAGRKKKATAVPAPPPAAEYDAHRALLTAMFGATFVGPVGHMWYTALDGWVQRLLRAASGPRFIATKVLLDTVVMGPFYVAAFFAWGCALIDRSGVAEFKRKMAADFWPTLTAEVSLWPIIQSVNFTCVPLRHQLLVINCFTIMDAAFMSWARNQTDWVPKVLAALGFQGDSKSSSGSSKDKGQLRVQPLVGNSKKGKKQ